MNNPLVQPDPGLFIWTIITFLVLLWLLAKFAWKPLLALLEKREENIRNSLKDAEKAREELEALNQKTEKLLAEARVEAQGIVSAGRAAAEKLQDDLARKAKEKSESLIAESKRQIQSEKDEALSEIKFEVVTLSLEIASKLIEKNLSDKDNRELIDSTLKNIQKNHEA
ncbi:MAG: F0F1 ATP synthase subunit B [Candidatus Neomarinimicrobiota bacterium]